MCHHLSWNKVVCSKLHCLWIDIFSSSSKNNKEKNAKKFWYSLTFCWRWIRFFFVRIPCLSEQICWDIFEKNCFAKNKVYISKIYVLTWTIPLRISPSLKRGFKKRNIHMLFFTRVFIRIPWFLPRWVLLMIEKWAKKGILKWKTMYDFAQLLSPTRPNK